MKRTENRKGIRLSTQVALFFSIIIVCMVLISSIVMTSMLRTVVLKQKSQTLLQDSVRLSRFLVGQEYQKTFFSALNETSQNTSFSIFHETYDLVDRIARQAATPYYMSYAVFGTVNNEIIVLGTNDPYLPILPVTSAGKTERYFKKSYYVDGDLNILYTSMQVGNVFLQTSVNMDVDSVDSLLSKLPFIVLLSLVPILLVSFFTARFLSARMLKPVTDITKTANGISASNLDRRIPESDSKDEIHALARTFNSLFARLQADFDRERQFTSDVSHELRTPLAVLLGHVDLLRRWGKSDPKILDESLETLHSEIKSMQSLVENLLLLSRSERQAPAEKLIIKMKLFLEKIIDDMHFVSPEVQFELVCPEDAVLLTNPDILTQILRILITNSIRYSPAPAFISLCYNSQKKQLSVLDKGHGISAEDLPHIFERLYRSDKSRNHKTGGSGLGLAIAKILVKNIDARIWAESEGLEKGTAMHIQFGEAALVP